MKLTKITTAGSVDDGKSTLIGRLMYDTKSVTKDKIEYVKKATQKKGKLNSKSHLDFSLFTDGLIAEREQGITIDVAHIFFSTEKTKFIIADSPGHEQYTRNMITGASECDVAIILLDAKNGVVSQTMRHLYIATLVGIQKIIVCINKMDLMNYAQEPFDGIVKKFKNIYSAFLDKIDIDFIPTSSISGENISFSSEENMPWYKGKILLEIIDNYSSNQKVSLPFRMYVQHIIRPAHQQYKDFRSYSGMVVSGSLRVGDTLEIFPSKKTSVVKKLYHGDKEVNKLSAKQSGSVVIEDDLDISRGDLLATGDMLNIKNASKIIQAKLCWMDDNLPLNLMTKYIIQVYSKRAYCKFKYVLGKLDLYSLEFIKSATTIQLNDIFSAQLMLSEVICFEKSETNLANSRFILINEQTNATVAVGVVG